MADDSRPIPIESARERVRKSRGAPAPGRAQLQAFLERLGSAPTRNGQLSLDAAGRVVGRFFRSELTSAFQHVVDARTGAVEGVEACVRCQDDAGAGLSPWQLFFGAADAEQAVALDRLCRTVHALNFLRQERRPELLFLKVHPRLVEAVATDHGRAFASVLRAIGIEPRRVVIELPPDVSAQSALAAHACANYRWNGFQVALEFARLPPAVQAIRSMRPDFVKFDVRDLRIETPALVDTVVTANQHDTRVIVARCEQPDDLTLAIRHGVDLLQGYAASVPAAEIFPLQPDAAHARL